MTGEVRAKRLVVEMCVVFFGVLVALAADSWWERRAELRRVDEYLEALAGDVAEARARLRVTTNQTEQYLATTDSFLSLLRSADPLPPDSRQIPVFMSSLALPTGTLDALVETGDINLLDDEIRTAVVGGRAAVAHDVQDYEKAQDAMYAAFRDRLLAAERIRLQRGLAGALIPARLVRESADMIASYAIHRGSLQNQLNSISNLEAAFDSIDAALERVGRF